MILIGCFLSSLSKAQNLTLSNDSGAIINNSYISIIGDPSSETISSYVYVTNNSSSSMEVKVKKVEISLIGGSVNTFCWGESCYPPSAYISVNPVTIASGDTECSFHGDYYPYGYLGTSIIAYVFFDSNNPIDTVCVNVKYTAGYVGINENSLSKVVLSNAYPNPANTFTTFDYSLPKETISSNIIVYNLLGSIVKKVVIPNLKGKLVIRTNDLKDGIYLYTLVINENNIDTRKLFINH